jgi:hypothetical protein
MLLTSAHRVRNGLRVRLRYPHTRDGAALAALCARLGAACDELELRRLLSFDPRRRRVIFAVGWLDGVERLVGAATTPHDGDPTPDVLLADEALAPGVGDLLRSALEEQERARVA